MDDGPAGRDAVRAEIEADVRRVAERLRTLSEAQLAAAAPPLPVPGRRRPHGGPDPRRRRPGARGAGSGAEPRWRDVPALSDFAVGDQVALTGHDLLAQLPPSTPAADHAVPAVGPEETVWARGARRTAGEVVADAAGQLAALRRLL